MQLQKIPYLIIALVLFFLESNAYAFQFLRRASRTPVAKNGLIHKTTVEHHEHGTTVHTKNRLTGRQTTTTTDHHGIHTTIDSNKMFSKNSKITHLKEDGHVSSAKIRTNRFTGKSTEVTKRDGHKLTTVLDKNGNILSSHERPIGPGMSQGAKKGMMVGGGLLLGGVAAAGIAGAMGAFNQQPTGGPRQIMQIGGEKPNVPAIPTDPNGVPMTSPAGGAAIPTDANGVPINTDGSPMSPTQIQQAQAEEQTREQDMVQIRRDQAKAEADAQLQSAAH